MSISCIHSYLVYPAKHEEHQPPVHGTKVPHQGKLFQMLTALYTNADDECDIEIVFRPSDDGQQENFCRSLITEYVDHPTIDNGRRIASHLQSVTTHRSGLGLLFIVTGPEKANRKVLMSRFPADQGVIAQERKNTLDVEFIERVFMKSAKAYKSVVYCGKSTDGDFWDGKAIDKQINEARELSNYWISEFLHSELRTTGPAGTKRLAIAIRETLQSTTNPEIRKELLSLAGLLPGQRGRRISPERLLSQLGISDQTLNALKDSLPRPELLRETFHFDAEEFARHVTYRSVELDNGAFLIGENAQFDDIFRKEHIRGSVTKVRYTTEGSIIDERLRKTL